jgi:hypothetical protein
LPALSAAELERLRLLRQRLLYHRADGDLLEGAVMLLVTSPLLELAGFYDAPFKLKADAAVEVTSDIISKFHNPDSALIETRAN